MVKMMSIVCICINKFYCVNGRLLFSVSRSDDLLKQADVGVGETGELEKIVMSYNPLSKEKSI